MKEGDAAAAVADATHVPGGLEGRRRRRRQQSLEPVA